VRGPRSMVRHEERLLGVVWRPRTMAARTLRRLVDELDVAPGEREQLAAAKARGKRGEGERTGEPPPGALALAGGVGFQLLVGAPELGLAQDLHLRLLDTRPLGVGDGVSGDEAAANGGLEELRASHAAQRLSRRALLVGGAGGAAALLSGPGPASASASTATAWDSYTCPESGASISYPASWSLDVTLDGAIRTPSQSFAVRTGAQPPPDSDGGMPDLSGCPAESLYVWLLDYDSVIPGDPPFEPGITLSSLAEMPQEFANFVSYISAFAGSERSFLLRVWVGTAVSVTDSTNLDTCLASLTVP
jgi:hypothetical protein